MTVVAVVNRRRGAEVALEASRWAEEYDTDLHVVFVLGLGRLAALELALSERVGIPVNLDLFRGLCANIADDVASTVVDEYEAVGLVGVAGEELLEYAEAVDATCFVIDARKGWDGDRFDPFQNTEETLLEGEVTVVPVY